MRQPAAHTFSKWPPGDRSPSPPPACSRYIATQTDYSGHLVIAVSQSGQTPEIVEVLRHARAAWRGTIAMTNDATSPLAEAADLPVLLGAGQELAVPATKTVTAQFAAFAIIAQSLGEVGLDDEVADELPAPGCRGARRPKPGRRAG